LSEGRDLGQVKDSSRTRGGEAVLEYSHEWQVTSDEWRERTRGVTRDWWLARLRVRRSGLAEGLRPRPFRGCTAASSGQASVGALRRGFYGGVGTLPAADRPALLEASSGFAAEDAAAYGALRFFTSGDRTLVRRGGQEECGTPWDELRMLVGRV